MNFIMTVVSTRHRSNFLLQKSKYALAWQKSPCYSRTEVGVVSDHE